MSGRSYQSVSSRRPPVKTGPNRSSQPASREATAQALGPISQSGATIHMRTTHYTARTQKNGMQARMTQARFFSLLQPLIIIVTAQPISGCCSACLAARCYCMTAGWGETEVPMDVSSRRLARVLHRHLAEHGLLSFLSLLSAVRLHAIKRNPVLKRNQAGI